MNTPSNIQTICDALKVSPPAGKETVEISSMAELGKATQGQVTFVDRDAYIDQAEESPASLILVKKGLEVNHPGAIEVESIWEAVACVLNLLHPTPAVREFVHHTAVVAESASVGDNVYIGPNVVVGDNVRIGDNTRLEANCFVGDFVTIGENCRFYPQVTILEKTEIQNRVVVHSGVCIGSDGFRYEATARGALKIPQVGNVVIEDDVEIGANSTIDCAFLHETRIGARTKIDNLVHIGHNVQVESDCIIVAQVGIAGSSVIGRGTQIGGQSGVSHHVKIGPGCQIAGHSGVHKDLPAKSRVVGAPAIDAKTFVLYMNFMKDFGKYWKLIKTFTGK